MKNFLFLIFVITVALTSCTNPQAAKLKRQQEITKSLDPQKYEIQYLGEFAHYDTLSNVLHDSIALNLASAVSKKFNDFGQNVHYFDQQFDEGHHNMRISKLTKIQREAYNRVVLSLSDFYKAYSSLIDYLASYQPKSQNYVTFTIDRNSFAGYRGVAYFDNENNLLNRKLIRNEEFKGIASFINHAKMKEYSFVTDTIACHISFPDYSAPDNLELFNQYIADTNSIIEFYTYKPKPYTPPTSTETSSSTASSDFPSGANLYRVKKQCGATYTKEANDRFTKYANANDLSSIDNMILNGEIEILNADEVVMMIDCGFALSQVKTRRGKILYVDTSSITKMN